MMLYLAKYGGATTFLSNTFSVICTNFLILVIVVCPIICSTKRTAIKKYKGGVSDYAKIKKELSLISKRHPNEYVTTMFDYYAMPCDTPGICNNEPDINVRIKQIEQKIDADIGQRNCNFHFMLHEFEGILFSKPDSFAIIANEDVVNKIKEIRDKYQTSEHINNSPKTAPSKILEKLIPNYSKVTNGTLLSKEMGINIIMEQCPHFREWIQGIAHL